MTKLSKSKNTTRPMPEPAASAPGCARLTVATPDCGVADEVPGAPDELDELPPLSELKDIGELEPQLPFAPAIPAGLANGDDTAADNGGQPEPQPESDIDNGESIADIEPDADNHPASSEQNQ